MRRTRGNGRPVADVVCLSCSMARAAATKPTEACLGRGHSVTRKTAYERNTMGTARAYTGTHTVRDARIRNAYHA